MDKMCDITNLLLVEFLESYLCAAIKLTRLTVHSDEHLENLSI